jgi:hypothetical protein
MKLREFNYEKDVQQIDEIFRRQPDIGVPSLNHVFDNGVVENGDGRSLAYGVVKEFAEAVLIIDRRIRKREKASAIKLVIPRAINVCRENNLEKLVIITDEEGYINVLKKHYGFKEVGGKVLFLEID